MVDGEFDLLAREHPEVFAYRRAFGKERLLVVLESSLREPAFLPPEAVGIDESRRLIGKDHLRGDPNAGTEPAHSTCDRTRQ